MQPNAHCAISKLLMRHQQPDEIASDSVLSLLLTLVPTVGRTVPKCVAVHVAFCFLLKQPERTSLTVGLDQGGTPWWRVWSQCAPGGRRPRARASPKRASTSRLAGEGRRSLGARPAGHVGAVC